MNESKCHACQAETKINTSWWDAEAEAYRPERVTACWPCIETNKAEFKAWNKVRLAANRAARKAAGPQMMAATDGNIMAMLMGAKRTSRR